jgi:ABC-2 type transport system permease protein
MNKIGIIIKREYLSRVRKKSFILSTLLTPLVFIIIVSSSSIIAMKNARNENVAVIDPKGQLKGALPSGKTVTYSYGVSADTSNFIEKGYSALLFAPRTGINNSDHYKVVSEKSMSTFAYSKIENDVSRAVENDLISRELKVDPARIDSIKKIAGAISVDEIKLSDLESGSTGGFSIQRGIGYAMAFLIYITLMIYGMMVMRGVMEEKTNRIAEVIVSSVRPFELMMGKIIGIGAVGLTQFLMWIVLIFGIGMIMTGILSHETLESVQHAQTGVASAAQASEAADMMRDIKTGLAAVNWGTVIFCFIFYFIGGYLFYASLFAAVGSAVNEDPQDVQSLTIPITMPIIISFILMVNSINDPNSSVAVWGSMIPFTSPILMLSRVPFGVPDTVPYWQLALSMLLLIGGFLFTTWLSGRIYRTGILLYGKKPTWKEMIKWIRR